MLNKDLEALIIHPEGLFEPTAYALRAAASKYPWFHTVQVLLTRKYHIEAVKPFEQQLQFAALTAGNKKIFRDFVEKGFSVVKEETEWIDENSLNEWLLLSGEHAKETAVEQLEDELEVPEFSKVEDAVEELEVGINVLTNEFGSSGKDSLSESTEEEEDSESLGLSGSKEEEDSEGLGLSKEEEEDSGSLSEIESKSEPEIKEAEKEEKHSFADWLHQLKHGDTIVKEQQAEEKVSRKEAQSPSRENDNQGSEKADMDLDNSVESKKEESRVTSKLKEELAEVKGLKSLVGKPEKGRKGWDLDRAIHDSVEENDEAISETLANIYISQGKIDHAIQIFEKLSLKYPEKSSTFADRIRELTKKK